MVDVVLPELGEGIETATVSYWHVKEEDEVKEGEDLVELSTSKATFNVPSPASGKIVEILVQEGEEANVGEILVRIDNKNGE